VKNRCASDETDSLVSSRAEESSQTRGAAKRSGTDHHAAGDKVWDKLSPDKLATDVIISL